MISLNCATSLRTAWRRCSALSFQPTQIRRGLDQDGKCQQAPDREEPDDAGRGENEAEPGRVYRDLKQGDRRQADHHPHDHGLDGILRPELKSIDVLHLIAAEKSHQPDVQHRTPEDPNFRLDPPMKEFGRQPVILSALQRTKGQTQKDSAGDHQAISEGKARNEPVGVFARFAGGIICRSGQIGADARRKRWHRRALRRQTNLGTWSTGRLTCGGDS
jgi:hypothetical protein